MKPGPYHLAEQRRQAASQIRREAKFLLTAMSFAIAVVMWAWSTDTDDPALLPDAAKQAPSLIYYSGCDEARAVGAAPIYQGQPGYRSDMDGDGDGVACEPYRGR